MHDLAMEDASITSIFAVQAAGAAARRVSFDRAARIAALETLRQTVLRYRPQIVAAMAEDFGKPAAEVELSEILPVVQEIAHAKRHLRRWMRPRRVRPTLAMLGTVGRVRPEPRGTCLIIAPWNYPFTLALGPLASALAAGNAVIVKPSELAPASSAVIAAILREAFSPDQVAVVEGGVDVAQELLAQPFDHIFFTGSPEVGKIVMAAAAKTLASVTLELGGKSPTIVGPGANIAKAARSIAWGKFCNTGQTCIAPDHVFVHRSVADAFAEALRKAISKYYGAAPKASADYGRVVNARHFGRLKGLLDEAVARGARVLQGGEVDEATKYIAPTILTDTTEAMGVSQEELFGPILPLIVYDEIDAVIARINAGPKPLTLYVFERDRAFAEDVIARTSAGSVAVNLTLVQFLHENLPFGGIGNSGLGAAHGHAGFLAFSHLKPVLRDRFSVLPILFPPYTGFVRRVIRVLTKVVG
ncbi:MAG: aldehyde dehydrogenase family protein [Limimaricola sp.]|nr:aldehyde dehydrogenase family protein [Limimaricola sp.]